MTSKFFFTKFENGCQTNAEFYADFESVRKKCEKLLTKNFQVKKGAKL